MATKSQSQLSPALFFKTVSAYQETEALRTALELDLFTVIHSGARDVPVCLSSIPSRSMIMPAALVGIRERSAVAVDQ